MIKNGCWKAVARYKGSLKEWKTDLLEVSDCKSSCSRLSTYKCMLFDYAPCVEQDKGERHHKDRAANELVAFQRVEDT